MSFTHSQSNNPLRSDILAQRPDYEGLQWGSSCTSLEVLPPLNLTWKILGEALRATGKPIGDLGASSSTVAAEGYLRGIPVVPVDLQVSFPMAEYPHRLWHALQTVQQYYCGDMPLKPGMELASPILHDRWEGCVRDAIEQARTSYLRADIAAIPVPARAFSISLVSDAVPKHSADLNTFLSSQLPEILRVTDQIAVVFPIAMFKEVFQEPSADGNWAKAATPDLRKLFTGEQRRVLLPHATLYNDASACSNIGEVASRCGFTFRLEHSDEILYEAHPEQYLGDVAALGVFERIPSP